MASEQTDSPVIYVQKIACVNNAAFVMKFAVEFEHDGEKKVTKETETYAVNQSRTIDLEAQGLTLGAVIRPRVHASGGKDELGPVGVRYAPNGQTLTYTVRGTTLNFSVNRVD